MTIESQNLPHRLESFSRDKLRRLSIHHPTATEGAVEREDMLLRTSSLLCSSTSVTFTPIQLFNPNISPHFQTLELSRPLSALCRARCHFSFVGARGKSSFFTRATGNFLGFIWNYFGNFEKFPATGLSYNIWFMCVEEGFFDSNLVLRFGFLILVLIS